ncbi:MAG: DUF1972 domain-containing protein [Thomasclavelia sp.]|nr:DUF1972 domain-containing protein [Thomasclavelia sp.]
MKNIFIVGSKGIPANYGGFETFVEKLTEKKKNKDIKYHVACLSDNEDEVEYNGARCFNVNVKNIGPAKAIYYDVYALKAVLKYVEENNINDGIVYILACRIGPFIKKYVKLFHEKNIKVYVNPDGHEFKRSKWSWPVRKYWKHSERGMVKSSDLLICDSKNIESYIQEEYKKYKPNTTYISYGADVKSVRKTKDYEAWCEEHNITPGNYYLIVGRFVPENNYEAMIREFKASDTKRDLVIITNYENSSLYKKLEDKFHMSLDERIKFVGTVYNQKLLERIRTFAYGYLHGHEVGGTNPSLLEALATTKLNLLINASFNEEVGEQSCVYWSKEKGSLKEIINTVDVFSPEYINDLGIMAKQRIKDHYSWDYIIDEYEKLFMGE